VLKSFDPKLNSSRIPIFNSVWAICDDCFLGLVATLLISGSLFLARLFHVSIIIINSLPATIDFKINLRKLI
jgi:hypothetical protein